LSGNEGVEVSEAHGVAASSSFLPGSEAGASLWEAEEVWEVDFGLDSSESVGESAVLGTEYSVLSEAEAESELQRSTQPDPSLALRACVALV
jgi:hypothetical protein